MPIIATLITVYFQTSFLVSIILYFVLPSLYLTIRDPRFIKKIGIIILASIPFTVIIDYFATRDGSWLDSTIFPFRVLNGFAFEDFIWVAAWFMYIISFYEYFIDQPRNAKDAPLNRNFPKLLIGWYGSLAIFAVLYLLVEKYLYIPYFYLFFTFVLGIFPTALILIKRPKFIHKFFLISAYFFAINMLHEWSAFMAKQWVFPGTNFIGWITLKGGFSFPIEEFVLWMMLGAVYLISYYEFFVDDTK